jgi:hypothetical protein
MANTDRKFQRMNAAVTYRDVACEYLRDKWLPLRNASKLLARLSDATPRAVVNWLAGENAPHGDTLITLMARDPDFEQIIIDLVRARRCTHGPILSNLDGAAGDVPED